MKLAAIDIGSNSIKLVVVDATASDAFAVLAREKETVRLAHNTLREGHLSASAIERACECVKRFRSLAESCGAERVVAIATASVREADNATEFVATVARQTGVHVEILSGIEEARLISLAVCYGCGAGGASMLNIDIGGGSTEISLVRDGVPVSLFSVKLGAVGLTEEFLAYDPPKPRELRALKVRIRGTLERPHRELCDATWQQTTGTSGTILAIGEALRSAEMRDLGRARTPGAQPVAAEVAIDQLERFNERIALMDVRERKSFHGISAERAEIVIAGGQILEGVMQALGIKVLRTCDWALREGVIIDRLREFESESRPPLPDEADQRLRAVRAVGRRFGYEESHALQVAKLAEQMFDSLAALCGLTRHQRLLLSAAALLHDTGYHIAHESHHKHSLYLIKHSELTGFSEEERAVIANVARYHRGSPPKERHPDYAALEEADRNTVCRLAALLRVANALDRSHDGRVREVRCTRDGQILLLELRSESTCEEEIVSAQQRGDLFEQVFGYRLSFTATRA